MEQAIFQEELARANAPPLIGTIGLSLVGPTIIAMGTEEQKERYLAPILSGEEIWCQGFSEPNAGSDLASLGTKAQERAPAKPASDIDRLAGMRILLVEDHHATRDSTARILRSEGAVVLEASDAKAGLDELRQGQVDVLLLDMMLPDIDGREVLRAMQGDRPANMKALLVLTGDLTPERLDEVKRLGGDALIGKPIDIDQLIATLRTVRRSSAME